ncbi:HD-GYP domain-containing protein [Paenibacillus physcomitrellae]|uniref:C-di-GMP phosphodiesterase n=1 Tax=Paenibacillus physcomitrellae TaxID=1619311 RepID=A0ABQ1FTA2_9BACL|nr:HD domain-containing phosphohydrolase [Paenibacillus physcomitrellae]GGA30064.1 c-di-GMP phosphodiesterase [Paenibacillus physcomitrellae]
MKVSVMNLQQGDRLLQDTFNSSGLHILGKGAVIKAEDIDLLLQHRVDYVEVETKPVTKEEEPASGALADEEAVYAEKVIKPRFDFTVRNYQSVFLDALVNGRFDSKQVDHAFLPMVNELALQKDVVRLLLMLERDDVNNYTHSIQVGTLSYYIASWLGFTEEECYQISKGGYLHDIGKCKVPMRIRYKEEPLTSQEWQEYRKHTILGYDLIQRSKMDQTTALIALQHHEREDGSGYPNGMMKGEIHPFAEIVAVADEYISMREKAEPDKPNNLMVNLKEMYALSFGKLSEKPVHALIQHMLPNFIGKKVQLSSGEQGVIVLNNLSDMFRPLIRIDGNVYRDLSKNRGLDIEEILL